MSELEIRRITSQLTGCTVGSDIHLFETLESTMNEAKRRAEDGAHEGTVVIAEEQPSGRGRFDRSWMSEPGNDLLFSVVFRPDAARAPYINMAVALSVCSVVSDATGLDASIKWPNDVKLAGRKVSGILVESTVGPSTQGRADGRSVHGVTSGLPPAGGERQRGGREQSIESTATYAGMDFMILGVGLNVNSNPAAVPEIAETATSMYRETGRVFDRADILIEVLRELDGRYALIRAGCSMREEWASRLETLGQSVVVRWQDSTEEGTATGVDEMGNLTLTKADGTTKSVVAGEVTLQA